MDAGWRRIKYLVNGDWMQVRVDCSSGTSLSGQTPQLPSFPAITISSANWTVSFEMRRKYCRNKFLNRNYFTWKHSNRECEFWDSLILNCDYICINPGYWNSITNFEILIL